MDLWPPSPTALRLAAGLAGLALVLGVERWRPFRGRPGGALANDLRNLVLWGAGAATLQLLPFVTSVAVAEVARSAGVGLLHRIALPDSAEILLTLVVLDAVAYALHRLYHALHPLWRLHRVHHSDETLTTTTGVRFHPGEVLVSALGRVPVVALLGASVTGIVAFEVMLLASSQLQHADVRLPDALDARLRRVFVSPNLHRIHHSTRRAQADSNFGTIFTIWDRLLGTYCSEVPPEEVVVGLPDGGARAPASVVGILAMPFRSRAESNEVG